MAEIPSKSLEDPAHNNTNDYESLVRKFQQGQDSVFDRIVEQYSEDIAVLANRLLGWPGDVEDVTQEIFLAAFIGLKKFRFECDLKTWLFTITINKCRAYRYKRILRLKFLKRATLTANNTVHAADKPLINIETFAKIRQALMALPVKYREPVVLKYLQELGTDEISRVLGISKNVLNVRLNRARKRLQKDLTNLLER